MWRQQSGPHPGRILIFYSIIDIITVYFKPQQPKSHTLQKISMRMWSLAVKNAIKKYFFEVVSAELSFSSRQALVVNSDVE